MHHHRACHTSHIKVRGSEGWLGAFRRGYEQLEWLGAVVRVGSVNRCTTTGPAHDLAAMVKR